MKKIKLFINLCIVVFLTNCTNNNTSHKKNIDLNPRGEFPALVFTTTSNGTWTGSNWTPSPPPNNLTNVAIIINHTIDYTTGVNINNWNKSNGSILINTTGALSINTTNNSVVLSNGFTVTNHGSLVLNLGTTGQFKIDKAGTLTNTGTVDVTADKVFILDNSYSDTSSTAGAQVFNSGTINMTNIKELHNDGYIENSGNITVSKLHNDGYICNSNVLTVNGETKLHENDIGFIGCGGTLNACDIEMDGGKIFDQNVCCLFGNTPIPPTIDSSKNKFETGDFDYKTVTICVVFLTTGITQFQVKNLDKRAVFKWAVTNPEVGDLFTIERSEDAINFEDRISIEVSDATNEGFTAEDELKSGIVYYRLKVESVVDNEIIYSNIISLNTASPKKEYKVYPNPSTDVFSISGEIPENAVIQITDMNGRTVFEKSINAETSLYQVNHNLDKGLYILNIKSNNLETSSQKVIVQ
jgi:hypothetical protein